MLISILILIVLSQINAAVINEAKRDNSIDDVADESVNKLKFFAQNFAQVFVKQKPVDFATRLKSLSNLDLTKILDNVIKMNQAVPDNNATIASSLSKVVEVKPVKITLNITTTIVKPPPFTSLKIVESRPKLNTFRGVFDGFKNVLTSKLSSVFNQKKTTSLDSLISSSLDSKLVSSTAKNKVIHEHKVVFIKAKIPILTGHVLSTPDDGFELIEVRPLNETLSLNIANSSEAVVAENQNSTEAKNLTLGSLFSTFNVTVPQFISSINNLTLPIPFSHIFGFMAKKKIVAGEEKPSTEKITRLNRPVIFLGRFPAKERETRQFNVGAGFGGSFGGGIRGGFGGGSGFPAQNGFGGGEFMGGPGFRHRNGGSNFNNNNMNGGGFGSSVNFNNNNLGGGGLRGGSNFNNNNFNNDYDAGGSVNFNNNNGR